MNDSRPELGEADKAHIWHPFTQMRDWCAPEHEPMVLVEGQGALLRDSNGRDYIDGNSSIWTNLHGHRHPRIDAAIKDQLNRTAHTSFLGFTHPPACELAAQLIALWPAGTLTRVFFSDDGSTAIEVALKMAARFWQLTNQPRRKRFVAFTNAYHGDTMGASSVGGVGAFRDPFSPWHFSAIHLQSIEELATLPTDEIAAILIEPLVQGAAGIRIWPRGWLARLRAWCNECGTLLIADEVMTGFGRTGTMFACEQEDVVPDLIALAKGLTGGYLPLAATLTTERIFDAFLGGAEQTFYYGHSYTANQLGCAAALANLAIFREEHVLDSLRAKIALLEQLLTPLRAMAEIVDVRQCGFIAGIELKRNAAAVCVAARRHGLLTRAIGEVVVLMPPFCIAPAQLEKAVGAITAAVAECSTLR